MINQLFDNFEVDVGFKQGKANLAQRLLHVLFSESTLAAQVLKGSLKFFGKILKHSAQSILTVSRNHIGTLNNGSSAHS